MTDAACYRNGNRSLHRFTSATMDAISSPPPPPGSELRSARAARASACWREAEAATAAGGDGRGAAPKVGFDFRQQTFTTDGRLVRAVPSADLCGAAKV
jgi:hypothetical protein